MKKGPNDSPTIEEEEGQETCVKWSLLIFNIFPLLLLGVTLVGLASWTLAQRSYIQNLQAGNGSYYVGLLALMLIAGLVLTAVAILGCVAAFTRNRKVIIVYYAFVLGIFLFLCISVILGYVYRKNVVDALRVELKNSIAAYNPSSPNDAITSAWDKMQTSLQCCGVSATGQDAPWLAWRTNKRVNSGAADSKVPQSCCLAGGGTSDCTNTATNQDLIYQSDCFDAAEQFFRGHVEMLVVCCIVFGVALIAAAVLSICHYFLID